MRVRPARADDHDAIAAFTTGTFEWGDYVPGLFIEWLDAPDSVVLVAIDDADQPIGIARAISMSPTEAWVHAARVHPDRRRTGVGSAMSEALCEWASDAGHQVVRLMTEDWNEAANRQVERSGYRKVSDWSWPMRELGSGRIDPITNGGRRVPGEEQLASGSRAEVDPAWIAWSSSEMASAGRGLLIEDWKARRMTVEDVRAASRDRSLLQCASGWVIARTSDEHSRLVVPWVVTNPLDANRLARAVVDLAVRRELESVMVTIPSIDWLESAFVAAGCELRGGHVWARPLQ